MKIMSTIRFGATTLALTLLICLAPATTRAQDAASSACGATGHGRSDGRAHGVRSGGPEVRVSDVDGELGTLARVRRLAHR